MAQVAPETTADSARSSQKKRAARSIDIQGILTERNKLKDQVLGEVIPRVLPKQAAAKKAAAVGENPQSAAKLKKKPFRSQRRWEFLYKLL